MRVSEIEPGIPIELLKGEKGIVSKIVGNIVRVEIPGEEGHREIPSGNIGEKSNKTLVEVEVHIYKITASTVRQSRDTKLHNVTLGNWKSGEYEKESDALMELVEHLIRKNNLAEDYIESLKANLDAAGD